MENTTYTALGLKLAIIDAESNLSAYTAQVGFNLNTVDMKRAIEWKAFWLNRVAELKAIKL